MNLRSTDGGARIRSRWALLAMASTVLLLSPAAQAQHMRGSGGAQWGGHGAGAPHNFSGGRHNGVAPRGFRHHGGVSRFVVIGGAGFWYPYAYPYGYDSSLATPAYNMPPPAPAWYYCEAAGVYYPYVTTCEGGWRVVPATPDQAYPAPQQ